MPPEDTGLATDIELQAAGDDASDDSGFDEGFDNQPPTETPGTDDEAKAKPDEPKPPTIEERIAAAEALLGTLRTSQEKSFGTAFGKIGGIERTLSSAGVDIDQADIDAMRSDGFEVHARALEKIRDLKVVRTGSLMTHEDQLELYFKLKDELTRDRQAEQISAKRDRQTEQVSDEHPDWATVAATPEFTAWKATQSAADQDRLNNSWSPGFIVKSLSAFKASQAKPKPGPADSHSTRRSLIDAAVTPRGTGGNPAANTEDEFDAGFKQR